MIDYNLHQHSIFSDGSDAPEKFIREALEIGFRYIGFSEHSPLPFKNPFSLQEEKIQEYIDHTDELKEEYKDRISVFRALEMDYVPGISENFAFWRERIKADYLIGSVHLVKPEGFDRLWFTDGPDYRVYDKGVEKFFEGNIKKAVGKFYEQTNKMIQTQDFEIIGHFDKIKMHNQDRFFTEGEKWYKDLVDETVRLIKENDLIVEVNTRGKYKKRCKSLFPDDYALKRIKDEKIPVLISSDAHRAEELSRLFESTAKYLSDFGFKEVFCYDGKSWFAREIK